MKRKTVLFLKGLSQYDVLRVALDEVAHGIENLGYDVIVLDFNDKKSYNRMLDCLVYEPIEFIFSFNGILLNLDDGKGGYFFDHFDVPIISFLVDNPIYHVGRLESKKKNLNIATFDRENAAILKRYFSNLDNSSFIPFFGFKAKHIIPYQDRKIDMLFVGTYLDPTVVRERLNELEDVFKTVAEKVIDILLSNTELSLEKALRQYLNSINFTFADDEFLELMEKLNFIDKYIRVYYRDKTIRTVLEAGIPVKVYGNGWQLLKEKYGDKLSILNTSEADLMTGIELMGNAKIVLSVMPWFKDGIQDRIISTMLNGAVCVTDSSRYMRENFSSDENVVFYSLDKLDELPGIINGLLGNIEKSSKIAANGQARANDNYSIDDFCDRLIEFAPENYKLHVKERLIDRYENSTNEEIIEILDFIKKHDVIVYNYSYLFNYKDVSIEVNYDEAVGMYYVNHKGKRMYYPKRYNNPDSVKVSYRFGLIEQDIKSPHRYLDQVINVKDGDVVIDAGVAEGNFSLDIIDKVSKLYLVECEAEWIEALQQTFQPYKEKVIFVNKFLSNKNDDYNITIDEMVQEEVNFIKMDIEGAELDALEGASRTMTSAKDLTCAICAYHKKNDETNIKNVLENYDFEVSTSKGFMFFVHDEQALKEAELRRGLVRGKKRV